MIKKLSTALLGDYSEIGRNHPDRRHQWVISKLSTLLKGQTILDAGAGHQPYREHCEHLKYTSQDFGQYDGTGDNKGIQYEYNYNELDIVSDICKIPVAANTFDNVLCTEVLEHVPDPVNALKELVRLTKPGGSIIITVPFASLTHMAPYHFSSGFNRYFFEHWFKELNCSIIELTYNGNYYEYIAQEILHSWQVAQKYSNVFMNLKEKLAQKIVLSFLKRASKKDKASGELLNCGIMLVAKKT